MEDLPCDVVFNIFARIPVKSLLQYRSVCKSWRKVIDDPLLANMHVSIATEEPGLLLLVHRPRFDSISLHSIKEDGGTIKASNNAIAELSPSRRCTLEGLCNGLLCFSRHGDRYGNTKNIFTCNPLKGEVISLPPIPIGTPMPSRQIYGLGFSPSTKEYKVLQVLIDSNFQTKIHTLGTKSWRDISSVPSYPIYGKPVFANGALHWKIDTQFAYRMEDCIISFNVGKEEFDATNLPKWGFKLTAMIDLIELRGCLAVVDYSFSTHIDIWVLRDYIRHQWVKEYSIRMKALDGRSDNGHNKVIGLWEHGKIFLSSNDNAFYSYDPKTDELSYIHITGLDPDTTISEICGHTGSLASPRLMTRAHSGLLELL